jgi:hypothetical protein
VGAAVGKSGGGALQQLCLGAYGALLRAFWIDRDEQGALPAPLKAGGGAPAPRAADNPLSPRATPSSAARAHARTHARRGITTPRHPARTRTGLRALLAAGEAAPSAEPGQRVDWARPPPPSY